MFSRSTVAALVVLLCQGCAKKPARESTTNPSGVRPAILEAQALADYVPSVGLRWLVQLRPEILVESPEFSRDWQVMFQAERLRAFTLASGINPKEVTEAWIAGYDLGVLYILDAERAGGDIESAFLSRAISTRNLPTDFENLTHVTGMVDGTPHALLHLRGHMVAMASGDIRLVKIVRAFAERKLKTTLPAMSSRFLTAFSSFESDAPVRAFLSGPYEEATDAVASGFVSGVAAVRFDGERLVISAEALGIWPDAEDLGRQLTTYTDQVLSTRELRALGWGFPLLAPEVSCVAHEDAMQRCRASGAWKSNAIAAALFRVTSGSMKDLIETTPEGWHPEATTREKAEDKDVVVDFE